MRRITSFILVLLLLFGLVRLFRFAQQYDPALERSRGAMPDISVELKGATIVSRARGVTQWSVQADRIDVKRPQFGGLEGYSGVDFHGIKNGKLYREGKLEAKFRARAATYDQPNGVFTIEGPLRLVSVAGDSMEADACIWSERTDEVKLAQGAHAVVQGHKLNSPFVLFSPRKRVVNCPQGAEAVFDEQVVRASNLVWDISRGVVDCRGPVSGVRPRMSFSAQGAQVFLAADRSSKGRRTHMARLRANNGSAQLRIEGEDFDPGVLR